MRNDSGHRLQRQRVVCATSLICHSASRFLVKYVLGALAAAIVCGPIGAFDEPEKGNAEQTQADQNLKNMQRAAAQYVLSTPAPSKQPFKFRETAIMRTSNPITSTTDGA